MDSLCVIDTRARADRTRVRSCTRAADLCDRSAGGQRRFGVVNCARCHDFICARLTFKLFYYFLPNFIEKVEKNVATDTTQLLLEERSRANKAPALIYLNGRQPAVFRLPLDIIICSHSSRGSSSFRLDLRACLT